MALADYFLKLDGVDGEATDSKHKGECQLESFSFGANQSGSANYGGGAGVGKADIHDLHAVMRFEKGSPKLFKACASGQHFPKAILVARKAGGSQEEYLKVTLSDVLVSSFNTSANGNALPMIEVALNFGKIEIEYKEQKPDGTLGGSVMAGWDAKKNQAT